MIAVAIITLNPAILHMPFRIPIAIVVPGIAFIPASSGSNSSMASSTRQAAPDSTRLQVLMLSFRITLHESSKAIARKQCLAPRCIA